MLLEPRPEVRDLSTVVHGGPDHAELQRLGLRPADVLDFSTNINPYGPSPAVAEAVARTAVDRYPDRDARALRAALAEVLSVSPRQLLVGNGASDLIWLVGLTFLRPHDRVLIVGPTFSEYARMAALMGARVLTRQSEEERGFAAETLEVSQDLEHTTPRLVFVCNPNNPTGTVLPAAVIAAWARSRPHSLFVIDESYLAFAPNAGSAAGSADNVLVLRSMTKDFALAGLRLGYAVGAEEVIALLSRVRPPWNVNALAQAAGLAALADGDHLAHSLERLARAKGGLVEGLVASGLSVLPSAVHFFLVRVGDGTACRLALLRRRILVRDGASFGLPAFVRICTRRPEENARLVTAFREVLR
jgi:L-threonine-O-3-phosphate decarboxylase